jgi:predicted RNA-binding Zn-ribbon protein involved in translation (DUF1610 family)
MEKKVDIRVVSTPVTVEFECPHCEDDVRFDYDDFNDLVGEPCDWKYSSLKCPKCEKEIAIDDVEWD